MLEHLNMDSHSRYFEAEQAEGEGKRGLSSDGPAGKNQHSHVVNGHRLSLRASLVAERSKYGHGKRLLQGQFLFLNPVAAVFFHDV